MSSVPKNKSGLEFLCRMNLIYHEERERHYSRCIRWTAFISVFVSSAAVVALSELVLPASAHVTRTLLITTFALLVVTLNAAALAFDWYGHLAAHARFKAKWAVLLIDAGLVAESDRSAFESLVRQVGALSAEEPPAIPRMLKRAEALTDAAHGQTGRSE